MANERTQLRRSPLRVALCVPLCAALCVATALGARPAHAQEKASAVTAAEDLFQNARHLFVEKRFAEACPMFAESYRLDAAGGTLQNLALCYEELGKLASAYVRFQELRAVSSGATPPRLDRVKLADEHSAKLIPRLARIRLIVKGTHRGLGVKIDDVTHEEVSWGSGVLLDPGEHSIVITAPGKQPISLEATARAEGGFTDVDVPPFEDAPVITQPVHTVAVHPLRGAGFVLGAVGLGALGAGAVFGVLTITKNQAGKDRCTGDPAAAPSQFDPTGHCYRGSQAFIDANDDKDAARAFGTVASVLVPLGIVGLGVGTYFVLHTKSAPETITARIRPSMRGVLVEGEF